MIYLNGKNLIFYFDELEVRVISDALNAYKAHKAHAKVQKRLLKELEKMGFGDWK